MMSSIFGEVLTFSQEKGPDVKLKVFGDEFYSRYENLDGYSVVYDVDLGLFCYAVLIKGEFVSSGVDLSQSPPNKIWRHFKESEEIRNGKFEERYAKMIPPAKGYQPHSSLKTFGPNKGLLEGRRVSEGEIKGLTVLVQFQDVKSTVTRDDVDRMLNGENYNENGNFCSVRDYYRLMSGGKLDYTNEVVGPVTLSRNRSYYTFHLLVEEALNLAVAGGLDLRKFDSQGEGIVDAVNFLYAGQTQYIGELWPHNHFIELEHGGVKTYFYMLSSMGRTKDELSIGTFCHENGHMLCRWPDLYDYGTRDGDSEKSSGLGYYCLMSAGNHNDYGHTPSPVCAYLRYLVGWCDNVVRVDKPGEYQALHGNYNTAMIYESRKINEYFLVENRSQIGLDEYIPASGLAVYHCDILGSNEWQGGTATNHYQCGLIQADGHLDLETNRNMGDEKDLFVDIDGIAISHSTVPSSNLWDGSESGLVISKVRSPGKAITFLVGTLGQAQVVTGSSSSGKAIPDRYTRGVSDFIAVDKVGTVKKIKVSVDISHPNIGDLKVELTSPGGRKAVLHNRAGGSQDNLVKTYDSDSALVLAAMIGQPLKGNWVLTAKDLVKGNIGKLNKWSLEATYS
ncbi:MAG TPA: M6 family metalloprotease domain-containing protein [Methanotrichaceae archaeon]|nr:M6 family metalloprotease domain-containing protein [Methanotrichaceae archaeon]